MQVVAVDADLAFFDAQFGGEGVYFLLHAFRIERFFVCNLKTDIIVPLGRIGDVFGGKRFRNIGAVELCKVICFGGG